MGGEAQQQRPLGPEAGQLDHDRPSVVLPVQPAAHRRHVHLLAQAPVRQDVQGPLAGGVVQFQQPPFQPTPGRDLAGPVDLRLAQAGQGRRVGDADGGGVRPRQRVPSERRLQLGDPGVECSQALLVGLRQLDTGAFEREQGAFEPVAPLIIEGDLAGVPPLGERAHPPVQGGVEVDGVPMRGQQRRDRLIDRVQLRVGVGRLLGVEGVERPGQHLPGGLPGVDHVGLGGGRRIGGQSRQLAELLGHAGLDGGPIVLGPDAGEVRQFERQRRR